MISDRSRDTEGWSNDAENSMLKKTFNKQALFDNREQAFFLQYIYTTLAKVLHQSSQYYAKIELIKQDFTQLYGRPWCLGQRPYFLLSLKEIFAKYLNYVKLPELPEWLTALRSW